MRSDRSAPGASVEIETSDNGANRDGSSRPSPKAKTSQWGAERVNEVEVIPPKKGIVNRDSSGIEPPILVTRFHL